MGAVLAVTALTSSVAACGRADPTTSSPLPPTGSTPGTSTVEPPSTESANGNEGGFGDPVWTDGDFTGIGDTAMRPLTGTIRLADDGCWLIELGGERAVLAVPEGFTSTDASRLVGPDGLVLTDGTEVDGTGALVRSDQVVGGAAGRWGTMLDYCASQSTPIAAFTVLAPAYDPTAVPVDELVAALRAAELDTPWPCGYGFAASTADQRIGLYLYAGQPPATGTVTLPDPAWSATVRVGKDLFVQHCDDVIESTEPPVVVAGDWPLVAGTFEVTARSDESGCAGTEARSRLTGAIVETPLGEVELPALDLVNTAWGCFAG